jgi:hydroxymethylpyrimidine/phosphomethylpyrimidine kinase
VLTTALAVAGLDPSGGAGLSADLRGFAAASVWGAAVAAVLTVQSTRGVRRVIPVAATLVTAQAEEVLADARVRAIKVGALGSARNVRAVAAILAAHPRVPSVVDPVMIPSRAASPGARLDGGVAALRALARSATLVTPNLAEASALLGRAVASMEQARAAAVALVEDGAMAALVKGGHGEGPEAVDWLALRGRAGSAPHVVRIARPRRRTPKLHGTGCSLSALIAGRLAAGAKVARRLPTEAEIIAAVRWARARLDRALARPLVTGAGLRVLDVTRR